MGSEPRKSSPLLGIGPILLPSLFKKPVTNCTLLKWGKILKSNLTPG
jgi:hypothetical protein